MGSEGWAGGGGGGERSTPDAPVAVELDDVSRRYATTTAVDDVSLAIREGEFFTLVGPSGCGKTTTLRLLAGFEPPTRGTIRFGGRDVAGVPPEDRAVGVVFQNYALFPHMTVGENVTYGLRFADPPGGVSREERVAELLDLVDLEGTRDRDPDSLSGGQQQRVALARALAPGPDLLLLDEPMSALDATLRERLRVQVKAIQRALDITTVYVTHDQEEALAISDRVAVMHDGAVEQVASPRAIYREPASRFVAEFVGDNNVFTGDVSEAVDGRTTVRVADEALTIDPGERELSAGDRVTFCVRPEELDVAESGLADATEMEEVDDSNALRATVTSAEFLGDTTRVHLEWEGQELLVRTSDPLDGDVTVEFDPGDAWVVEVD